MDAARAPRNALLPVPPPLPQEYDDEPEYSSRRRCIPCIATRPSAAAGARASSAARAGLLREPQQRYAEQPQQQYADEPQQDPSRYDDALYGRLETGEHDYQRDPAYPDDPYAYQGDEYEEEPAPKKRSSGLMTVAAVLALAVVGTGAAFAYRTFVGSPRSGEPPIIKADNSPTKVVPAPSDAGAAKTPDRMLPGDGGEKLVSREETPVDVNSRSGGPRVVFPPLNQNANPPPASSVSPSGADALRPPTARCRTTSRAGSGRSPSRATPPTTAAFPQAPARRRRGRHRRRDASLPRLRLLVLVPRHRRRVTLHRPMPAPIRRCCLRRRRRIRSRRPGWLRPTRRRPRRLPRVGAVFWYR